MYGSIIKHLKLDKISHYSLFCFTYLPVSGRENAPYKGLELLVINFRGLLAVDFLDGIVVVDILPAAL